MSRFLLEIHGDPNAIIRLLRELLKRLGRDHGVRCKSIAPVADDEVSR